MSIIDLAKDLEYFSEKDLVEELQNPSGSYPRYIVLSELEGRNKLNKATKSLGVPPHENCNFLGATSHFWHTTILGWGIRNGNPSGLIF